MSLSVGSDPEFMLRDMEGNLVSSVGLLGGTKHNPRKTKHGYIQEDNVTAEVNTLPANSLLEFLDNHRLIMEDLSEILEPLDLSVDIISSALFSDELLSHPSAQKAGCLPDYNAWLRCKNPRVHYSNTNIRAAGGHLHIGSDSMVDPVTRMGFVKALDLVLGVPSVYMDEDVERRELYGKAGSFRPKELKKDGFNGIEYRVLSNFWMRSVENLTFAYTGIEKVHNNLQKYVTLAETFSEEILFLINEGSSKDALSFVNLHKKDIYA